MSRPQLDDEGNIIPQGAPEAAPVASEAQEGAEVMEPVDFGDVAAPPRVDHNAWRSEAKTRLVAAGMDPEAAHLQAFEKTRESTERLVAALGGGVDSGRAGPHGDDPTGSSHQGSGASESEGQGGDGRSASDPGTLDALRAELADLRQTYVATVGTQKVAEMQEAREQLASGAYPELRNGTVVESLKPAIRALTSGPEPVSHAEAVRLATFAKFGVRDGSDPTTDKVDASVPNPGRVNAPGRRAANPDQVRSRIADMVYNGRSEEEVMGFAAEQRRRGFR